MTTLAKVVGRTDGGGIIFLNSTDTSSDLIFAHPTLGVQREHFDGPCRKVEGNACVHYESVHVGGSTTITVTDKGLLLHTLGLCSSCMGGDHDFDTWPTCPSGDRKRKQGPEPENVVPLPSEPAPEPSSAPSNGAAAKPSAPAPSKANVRVLDPQLTPAPEESVTPPELRWGPGPGAGW
jgi:hypothetical protein